jgi:hypothetical protein
MDGNSCTENKILGKKEFYRRWRITLTDEVFKEESINLFGVFCGSVSH